MGRFYKTTMPTYENFVDEIPYELLGMAIAKKEADLANAEKGLSDAGQSLAQLKTRARSQDSPLLDEKINQYQKIIDDSTQKLVANPGEYRNINRQLKQVSAQLQNEMNNGDIGKIVREHDQYQTYLKDLAKKRDLLLKSGKVDPVLVQQEYEQRVAQENEDYKGYNVNARGGNFAKWDVHGTDFKTEVSKVIAKIKPTSTEWSQMENFATAQIDRSGSAIKVTDNAIVNAMYEFMQTPTGRAVLTTDVSLNRYSPEELDKVFVSDGKGNIVVNPDPEVQGTFKAIMKTVVNEYRQSKTTSKTDRTKWSKTGERNISDGISELNTHFQNNYLINGNILEVTTVDKAGVPYYAVNIGGKNYAVSIDVLNKLGVVEPSLKANTPPVVNPENPAEVLEDGEVTNFFSKSELIAYNSFLGLTQYNQQENSVKRGAEEFENTNLPIIKNASELQRLLATNRTINASTTGHYKYGGIVMQNGGKVPSKRNPHGGKTGRIEDYAFNLTPRHNVGQQTVVSRQQTQQPQQPVFIGLPSSTVNYSTPNKTYEDYLKSIGTAKAQLANNPELDLTGKAMLETQYKNSKLALENLNTKLYAMMEKEGITNYDKVAKADIVKYGVAKRVGEEESYYAENLDKTVPIEELLTTALAGNKNKAQHVQNIVAKTFFSHDGFTTTTNLKGVFVDDGKVLVSPEAFLKFYENVVETDLANTEAKGGFSAASIPAVSSTPSELAVLTRNLKNTYAKVKKEVEAKNNYFDSHVKHLDKLQNIEEASNVAISFTQKEFEDNVKLNVAHGVAVKDVIPLKNSIQEAIKTHLEFHPKLAQDFKSFVKYENEGEDAGVNMGLKGIDLNNLEVRNLMFTQRGIDLVIGNNSGTAGVRNEVVLTLPNEWNSKTATEKRHHTWLNLTNAVVDLVKNEYADNLKQAGITDPFNPIYKVGDQSFDLSSPETFKNGDERLRLIAENRHKYIILNNINLAQQVAENYANLPVAQINMDFTESKTGFIRDAKRQPKTNFVIYDPKSNLNFKVSKTDNEKFTIFAKDYKSTQYKKIAEVEDNPINLQKEIIEISEKTFRERNKTKK